MRSQSRLMISNAVVLGALLLAGAASAFQPGDAWTTTQVKFALLADPGVEGMAIDVDTFDGMVTLHGKLGSEAERTRARLDAQKVDGVRGVRNVTVVVPEAERDATTARDAELLTRIEATLEVDPSLASSSVHVRSVSSGVVLLSGDAASLSAHRHALDVVESIDDVESVVSSIHSPDPVADVRIWQQTAPASTDSDSALRTTLSDAWITAKAKTRLLTHHDLSLLDIHVDTRDGVVTLFGIVDDATMKLACHKAIMELDGVRRVDDQLQVVPVRDVAQARELDEQVLASVEAKLAATDEIESGGISVAVQNGVVRLTGSVVDPESRLMARSIARSADGVRSVIDDLQIEQPS
jgi:hyperosmotically inducible protein